MREKVLLPIGFKSGKLTIKSEFNKPGSRHFMYLCLCDCGNEKIVRASSIASKNTQSCGCIAKNKIRELSNAKKVYGVKDNGKITSEYSSWRHMRSRCYNFNNAKYKNYGARGITVCERWRYSFSNFLSDMGKKPYPNYSLERIDVNGNYEPSNCCWIPMSEQSKNRQFTIRMDFADSFITQADLARILKVGPSSIEFKRKRGMSSHQIAEHYLNIC